MKTARPKEGTGVPRPAASGSRAGSALARLSSPRVIKRFLYSLYTHRLRSKVALGQMPRHIGVVLDGNRRYALQNGYAAPAMGHQMGTEKVDELLLWCDRLEIPVVTLWILSIDNLARDAHELEGLFAVVEEGLPRLRDLQASLRHARRIKASGRIELLPPSLRATVADVERETAHHGPFLLNIAACYGGREEIVDAVKDLLRELGTSGVTAQEAAETVSLQAIERHLYLNGVPDPDLIIRTSGEVRLSGFMLWQSAYSEYYFCDALWPEFREIDFLRAIRSYQQRRRRHGQ
ncbi:MAG: polyprenyl diphosphate synthase [Dehalococcoidia bacterium]